MTRSLKKNPFVANHLLRKIRKVLIEIMQEGMDCFWRTRRKGEEESE